MNTKVQVQVPVPITMLSDEDIVAEINRRQILIKWAKKAIPEPDNRGRSFASPSCKQETWDCTKPGLVKKRARDELKEYKEQDNEF